MRGGAWLGLGLGGVALALASAPPKPKPTPDAWTLFVVGELHGHLAPCGCSAPQRGGLERRAAVIATGPKGRTAVLDMGGWLAGTGEQDLMKAQTIAATLASGPPSVVAQTRDLTALESRLPAIRDLSGAQWLAPGSGPQTRKLGPWSVGRTSGLVMAIDGPESTARTALRANPKAKAVVYRGSGPSVKVGSAWLVPVGDKGLSITRLTWSNGAFGKPLVLPLGAEWDRRHAPATKLYQAYLRRVGQAGLLERLPREDGEEFAGDAACASCHAEASAIHEKSAHAHALDTLEKVGHDRDPDCVSCHVVGLDKTTGFRSRAETPKLARVGCESCHGPSATHARTPTVRTPLDARKQCVSCHTPDNSPRFNFDSYWKKIRH